MFKVFTDDAMQLYKAQNPLHTFSRNFPVDGEAANLLSTSRCNGIWERTRRNRHNGLFFCANFLWTCYGETGAMAFGLLVDRF